MLRQGFVGESNDTRDTRLNTRERCLKGILESFCVTLVSCLKTPQERFPLP